MELRGPAGRALGGRGQESEGLQRSIVLRLQGFAGLQPQRGLGLRPLVQDQHLAAPEGPVPDEALHRQGIEHLMGQHHAPHRLGHQLAEAEPAAGQRRSRQQRALPRCHAGIGLHQHQRGAGRQLGPAGHQGLGQLQGQLTLAGAGFHQGQGPITGLLLQPLGDLGDEQGREIGSERGRGGEITAGAHLQPTAAIGAVLGVMQGPLHVEVEGHRTAGGPQALRQPQGCRRRRWRWGER